MLHSLALTLAASASTLSASAQFGLSPTHADLVYATVEDGQGGSTPLLLDLYLPNSASTPLPTVVWIHGGGWKAGTKALAKAAPLVQDGYAVASIDYRLSGQASWPAQIHDCKAAIRWLRAHATDYGLDPDRFGVSGSSAGGHLATYLALSGGVATTTVGATTIDVEGTVGDHLDVSSRVQAVVDYYGPTDLLRMSLLPTTEDHDLPTSSESLLISGGAQSIQALPELTATAGAIRLVSSDDPPLRAVQGTADLTVPYEQSERLWRAATESFGLDWDLIAVPDGGHGGPGYPISLAREWFDLHLDARATRVTLEATGAPSESGQPATVTVTRTGGLAGGLSVGLTVDGQAREHEDLLPLPRRVRFAPGETARTLTVTPLDDPWVEGSESLRVALSPDPGYRIGHEGAQVELVLLDDEAPAGLPVVSANAVDRVATEGSADTARVRVERAGSTAAPLTVALRVGGVARPGLDHGLTLDQVTLAPGQAAIELTLAALDDPVAEPNEVWTLEVLPGADYVRGASRVASGYVVDDDRLQAAAIVSLISEAPVVAEGEPLTFVGTRTGDPSSALIVPVGLGGSAQPLADFGFGLGLVQFAPGSPYGRISATASTDGTTEGLETVELELLATPGGAVVLSDVGANRADLLDGDLPPGLGDAVDLWVGPTQVGHPLSLDLETEPNAFAAVWIAPEPGYFPLFGQSILIDPAGALELSSGPTDSLGGFSSAIPLADQPAWIGLRFALQALSVDGAGVLRVSELVLRRL